MSYTRYNAVSNCDWRGYPPSRQFLCDEQSFGTLAEAKAWLAEKRCGGAVSAHIDGDFRIVALVEPG